MTITASSAAKCQEMIIIELHNSGLNISEPRMNFVRKSPSLGRLAESGKEGRAGFADVFLVGSSFMVNWQQEIAVGELNRLRSDHQPLFEGNNLWVAPGFCSILGILVFD